MWCKKDFTKKKRGKKDGLSSRFYRATIYSCESRSCVLLLFFRLFFWAYQKRERGFLYGSKGLVSEKASGRARKKLKLALGDEGGERGGKEL
jgi:hypothetical protein